MGAPVARRLAGSGFGVRAWNRPRETAQPLAEDGVDVLDEAAEAVRGADAVLTRLADGDVVRAVMTDEGALDAMDAKDARLVSEAARDAGLDLPLPPVLQAQLERGVQAGHGDEDMAATVETLRS